MVTLVADLPSQSISAVGGVGYLSSESIAQPHNVFLAGGTRSVLFYNHNQEIGQTVRSKVYEDGSNWYSAVSWRGY